MRAHSEVMKTDMTNVLLVVTLGMSSLDLYSKMLSTSLHVLPVMTSDIYLVSAGLFGVFALSLRSLKALINDYRFVKALNSTRVEIVHMPHQHLARYINFLKKKCVVTVHDLIRFFDMKGHHPALIHRPNLRDRIGLKLDYRGVRKAGRVIAISKHTKNDLVKHLKVPEEKIDVIYQGIDHKLFKPTHTPAPIKNPYILYVGSEQPRKNISTLLKAFYKLKKGDRRFSEIKLVKVGSPGKMPSFRKNTLKTIDALNLHKDVVFAGFVQRKELPNYYSNAKCLVLPSLYEGFGRPVLEAMACGCPVITSNTSSLPEVVGDAGLMVDPRCVNALKNAMKEVLINEGLRRSMVKKGLKRASNFSWQKTAKETSEVYKEIAR